MSKKKPNSKQSKRRSTNQNGSGDSNVRASKKFDVKETHSKNSADKLIAKEAALDESAEEFSYEESVRLKAFLRKAVAIIAGERGLNARSRMKLESLARRQKLPDPLFDEAIRQLQEDDRVGNVNRYEQEFMNYLAREFQKLKGGVISLRMEKNAIELAESKYQIPPSRAEQLIARQAKLAVIGRVARSDAEDYATQFITERIGERVELNRELQDEIYQRGHNLGLSRERVDAEILRLLEINRVKSRSGSGLAWVLAALLILVAVGIMGAFAAGWFSIAPPPQPIVENNNLSQPEKHLPTNAMPDWISQATANLAGNIGDQSLGSQMVLSQVFTSDPMKKEEGYQKLVEMICKQSISDPKFVEDLICRLYYEDPDEQSASVFLDTAARFSRLPPDQSVWSVQKFKQQFRANELFGLIYFFNIDEDSDPESTASRRKQLVADQIQSNVSSGSGNWQDDRLLSEVVFSEYIQHSERAIAVGQWSHVIQNSWQSPGQAAAVVRPLSDMTRSRLVAQRLRKFQLRLLFSILERDPGQHVNIHQSMRDSISAADNEEVIEWIQLFQNVNDESFKKFVAPLLLSKTDLNSTIRLDEADLSLSKFVTRYRNRVLQHLLSRNTRVNQLTERFIETFQASTSSRAKSANPKSADPDQVAQFAVFVNLNLMICENVQRSQWDEGDFTQVDQILKNPKIRLRDLISLSAGNTESQVASATASDQRRKNEALEKLQNLASHLGATRINALTQLENIAPRFDDLSYAESSILATYLLADLSDEEALNNQRLIGAFSDWPSLGLAIADQIAQQTANMDHALTIARLLLNHEFELANDREMWGQSLQKQMIKAIALRTKVRIGGNIHANSDWSRLELYLAENYRQRVVRMFNISNKESDNDSSARHPSDVLLATVERELESGQRSLESVRRLKSGYDLIRRNQYNELEKTILAGQLLLELMRDDLVLTNPELEPEFERMLSLFDAHGGDSRRLGDQLILMEQVMLKAAILKRESMIDHLLQRN